MEGLKKAAKGLNIVVTIWAYLFIALVVFGFFSGMASQIVDFHEALLNNVFSEMGDDEAPSE